MKEYHKILTLLKRNPESNFKTLLDEYACPEFIYLRGNTWVFTEKIDGTNIRVMWNGMDVAFGGKTDNAQLPTFLVNRLNDLFNGTVKKQLFKTVFNEDCTDVCLYGEGFGAKIQKGGKYITDGQDFVLFDVRIAGIWLNRADVVDIATKFGIQVVPIICSGNLPYMIDVAREGFQSQWGDFIAEGIVARPDTELLTRRGSRIITKLKYKDFH